MGTITIFGRSVLIGSSAVTWNLANNPILIYQQNLLAIVLTESNDRIRVVTAYKLDAGQKRDYFARRLRRE